MDSLIRTAVLYLVLMGAIRLMGKRQVGQMEPSEFVVTMLVANLASIPMEDLKMSVFTGIIPIAVVLVLELGLSWVCLRSVRLRRLFCGKPVILIENGRILRENLRRTRVSLDELTGQLREKDVLDILTVRYAILETNGNISVFLWPDAYPPSARDMGIRVEDQPMPVTLVADGYLYRENLARAGKDELWLDRQLRKKKTELKDTLLLTVDENDRVVFLPMEKKERG